MAHRKLQDAAVILAVRLVQPTKHPISKGYAEAARLLDCSPSTVAYTMLRVDHPRKFAKWIENKRRQGFKWRGTDGKPHRKAPVTPSIEEIKVALAATGGDCWKAARLLGCSKTPVRNYVLAQRAKGRSCGRYKVTGCQIATALPKNAKSRQITELEQDLLASLREHMGDELTGVAA